jgi:hypothetical protein
MRIDFNWDWQDFGIMFRIFKASNYCGYKIIIDIQIIWLNIWIKLYKK